MFMSMSVQGIQSKARNKAWDKVMGVAGWVAGGEFSKMERLRPYLGTSWVRSSEVGTEQTLVIWLAPGAHLAALVMLANQYF